MNHLLRNDPLDDFFRGFFVRPVDMGGGSETAGIKIDVAERENAFIVHAEMPGVSKEDIHVTVDGAAVIISAERKDEGVANENERVLRKERFFGKLTRSFQLGQEIDDAAAAARFTDGVLELTLPKRAAAQSKRLTIN